MGGSIHRVAIPIDETKSCGLLRFLYGHPCGRILLKLLVKPCISKVAGKLMDSKISTCMIKRSIDKGNVDMNDYQTNKFVSYNDYFTRKIRQSKRPVNQCPQSLICPCDAKLSVYPIQGNGIFCIKSSYYTLEDLLQNKELADEYANGYCLIFRLAVDDYHRYCFIDSGTMGDSKVIPGELHTVQPIALRNYNIYKRNCREYTILNTDHFGKIVQIEVGAMMIGRIRNDHAVLSFCRGEEKGYFEFGGSTIVLLLKHDAVTLDDDIIHNSENNCETVVKFGEKIGEGILTNEKTSNKSETIH